MSTCIGITLRRVYTDGCYMHNYIIVTMYYILTTCIIIVIMYYLLHALL